MERLLWRAGFGPAPGEAQQLAAAGVQQAVSSLTRPSGSPTFTGPTPTDENGLPLAPADAWGHDHLYWLDRMVRSDQPLVERMALIWHDWFATSEDKVGSQQHMLDQTDMFRHLGLGSFLDLFLAVTQDPAMLIWLDGTSNNQWDPNENYAREMMELFSLGADRGAYTENDVREMARALTGWRNDWSAAQGNYNFRFDPSWHDSTTKTVFGQSGTFDWTDAVRLCVSHPLHPSFFVTKLWGYFIPTPPDGATLASLQGLYLSSGYNIRAVVEAILMHPDLYTGEERVVEPVVFNAGLLRAIGRGIDTSAWVWLSDMAGQQLYHPPNVAGWDYSRWLDTTTIRAAVADRQLRRRPDHRRSVAVGPDDGLRRHRGPGHGAAPGARPLGQSQHRPGHVELAEQLRILGPARLARGLAAESLPRHAPERAAHADRLLP